jgi:hypothetical protein
MSFQKSELYVYKDLKPGTLRELVEEIEKVCSLDIEKTHFTAHYSNETLGKWEKKISKSDIENIHEFLNGDLNSLNFIFGDDSNSFIIFDTIDDLYLIIVSVNESPLLVSIFELIEKKLGLEKPTPEISKKINFHDRLDNLDSRLSKLENEIKLEQEKIKVFLSYRFGKANSNYALELGRFLNLAGVDVVSGAGYEPRRISDKVMSKISENIDVTIYLVSESGESTWIRDEMAVSLGKGYHIIPIVEKTIKLESGMLSDWEYIPFAKGHIEDAFIRLLEAINFIRNERRKKA